MAWALKATPRTVKVTARVAREFAEMDPAPQDRPIGERRLNVYRAILKEGGFRPVAWARAYCKETGGVYRVNGKHTSTLFSSVELADYPDLYAVVEDYVCDTLEDVAKLYATYDSRVQMRNSSDINRSFAATIPEFEGLAPSLINYIVGALGWYANPNTPHEGTAAERAERLFDHVEFGTWVGAVFSGGVVSADHIRRVPVVGAMAACYYRSKSDSEKFWVAVRDETGAKPSLPDRKLARYLLTNTVKSGGGSNYAPPRFRATPREFYVKCIHAWNAWRGGGDTDLKYYAESKIPAAR